MAQPLSYSDNHQSRQTKGDECIPITPRTQHCSPYPGHPFDMNGGFLKTDDSFKRESRRICATSTMIMLINTWLEHFTNWSTNQLSCILSRPLWLTKKISMRFWTLWDIRELFLKRFDMDRKPWVVLLYLISEQSICNWNVACQMHCWKIQPSKPSKGHLSTLLYDFLLLPISSFVFFFYSFQLDTVLKDFADTGLSDKTTI